MLEIVFRVRHVGVRSDEGDAMVEAEPYHWAVQALETSLFFCVIL